jgi:YrbI family 3-deoxy-D-manno-octulosonate 8-phosphate phosphatase
MAVARRNSGPKCAAKLSKPPIMRKAGHRAKTDGTHKDIRLIGYDFDGVMTDNRVYVSQDGTESVLVNRSDGLAIAALRRMGIPQFIASTEKDPVVSRRAEKLEIPVLQGLDDKADAIAKYAAELGVALEDMAFIGNDVNDLAAMKIVGLPVAPHDAHPSILKVAKHVTKATGGMGVVREFCDTFFEGAI